MMTNFEHKSEHEKTLGERRATTACDNDDDGVLHHIMNADDGSINHSIYSDDDNARIDGMTSNYFGGTQQLRDGGDVVPEIGTLRALEVSSREEQQQSTTNSSPIVSSSAATLLLSRDVTVDLSDTPLANFVIHQASHEMITVLDSAGSNQTSRRQALLRCQTNDTTTAIVVDEQAFLPLTRKMTIKTSVGCTIKKALVLHRDDSCSDGCFNGKRTAQQRQQYVAIMKLKKEMANNYMKYGIYCDDENPYWFNFLTECIEVLQDEYYLYVITSLEVSEKNGYSFYTPNE